MNEDLETKKYKIEKILDYIKSLQQENKKLKVKNKVLEGSHKLLIQHQIKMYEDLDRAIKYIKENNKKYIIDDVFFTELLEILGDKE